MKTYIDEGTKLHIFVGHFLYDDFTDSAFLYFWPAQSMSSSTHHFMTVREFYNLFDTTAETLYEFW